MRLCDTCILFYDGHNPFNPRTLIVQMSISLILDYSKLFDRVLSILLKRIEIYNVVKDKILAPDSMATAEWEGQKEI